MPPEKFGLDSLFRSSCWSSNWPRKDFLTISSMPPVDLGLCLSADQKTTASEVASCCRRYAALLVVTCASWTVMKSALDRSQWAIMAIFPAPGTVGIKQRAAVPSNARVLSIKFVARAVNWRANQMMRIGVRVAAAATGVVAVVPVLVAKVGALALWDEVVDLLHR